MNYLLTAVIAIVAWQLVTAIAYFVSGQKANVAAVTGMGVWSLVTMLVSPLYSKIKLHSSRKYNCYEFYEQPKTANPQSGWIGNYYMTPRFAAKMRAYTEAQPEYSIKLIREGRNFKSLPPKFAIINSKTLANGKSPISVDTIQKFIKE